MIVARHCPTRSGVADYIDEFHCAEDVTADEVIGLQAELLADVAVDGSAGMDREWAAVWSRPRAVDTSAKL